MSSYNQRIVIVSPAWPLRGGISASTERLAFELESLGHEVVIISFSLQYPSLLFPGKTQFSDEKPTFDLDIRPIINSINPFSWLLTIRKIRMINPDIVLYRYWMPFFAPSFGIIARGIGKVKQVCLADNVIPHEKRFGDSFLNNFFLSKMDRFVAMSGTVKSDLKKLFPQKNTILIPHPVYDHYGLGVEREAAAEELGLAADKKYLLFFGFIRHYKGLDILIESLAIVKEQFPNLMLLVAGEFYEDKKPYLDLIEKNGLKDRVIIHDHFIPNEKVRFYFSLADMIVQPYRTATQSGITQMAYHFLKPVVVTDVGGLSEIIEHMENGYVVPTDPEFIAASIEDYLLYNRQEAFQNGMEKAKSKFSWKALAESVVGVDDSTDAI
jgi:D-inositol-3-phosphate glycosyltransferase